VDDRCCYDISGRGLNPMPATASSFLPLVTGPPFLRPPLALATEPISARSVGRQQGRQRALVLSHPPNPFGRNCKAFQPSILANLKTTLAAPQESVFLGGATWKRTLRMTEVPPCETGHSYSWRRFTCADRVGSIPRRSMHLG